MARARFFVGQLVEHLKFGYRGVVFGVDPEFSLTDEWYDAVAKSRPPKDQPWYQVMVDGASNTTYVAERHLQASEDFAQIDNPFLGQYFGGFDGRKYLPNKPPH
jgi:heat shock protein HspQ